MPNRIIREGILESEAVNSLGWGAEVFYRRLLNRVDDYGRCFANEALLRASLYPLKLDRVSNRDMQGWLQEVEAAGLIKVYEVEGKRYVEVQKFNQQVRAKQSKYPAPPTDCTADAQQVRSKCVADAQHMHTKTESKTETKTETSVQRAPIPDGRAEGADEVWCYLKGRAEIGLRGEELRRCAEAYFNEMEGGGWLNKYGHPVRDWRALARTYAMRWQERVVRRAPAGRRQQIVNAGCNDPSDYEQGGSKLSRDNNDPNAPF